MNQWAIIKEQEEGEEYDKYYEILATTSEEHLQEKVNELKVVLNHLLQDLNEKNNEELFRIQS